MRKCGWKYEQLKFFYWHSSIKKCHAIMWRKERKRKEKKSF